MELQKRGLSPFSFRAALARGLSPLLYNAALALAVAGLLTGAAAAETDSVSTVELRRPLLAAVANEGEGAVPVLMAGLESPDRAVRLTAAHLLANLPTLPPEVIEEALAAADDSVRGVIISRIVADGALDDYLRVLLKDPSQRIALRLRLQLVPAVYVDSDGTLTDRFIDLVEASYAGAPQDTRLRIASIVTDFPTTERSRAFLESMVTDARPGIANLAAEAMVDHINELIRDREYQAIIDEYAETDVDGWPAELAYGLHYGLGFAHYQLRDAEAAERELATAIAYQADRRALLWAARNYRMRLDEPEKAIEHYIQAVNTRHGATGSLLRGARMEGAALLRDAGRYDEALEIIVPGIAENRGAHAIRMRLVYASILQAKGDSAAAVAEYQDLLASGELSSAQTDSVRKTLEELGQ